MTWSCARRAIARLGVGLAWLVAVACGGDGATTPRAVLTTLSMSLSAPAIQVGETATATLIGRDANGTIMPVGTATWGSSAASVAVVNVAGVITGVTPGQAIISAAVGTVRAQAAITVLQVPVSSVTVAPSTLAVVVGESQPLVAKPVSATGAPLTERVVTWSSSDSSKLTVTTGGIVKGVAPGTATVSATIEGKTGTAAVTVSPLPAGTILAAIKDPLAFVAQCPTSDSVYARIRADFEFRHDGVAVPVTVTCIEPYTSMSGAQMTNELLNIQVLRLAWYMNDASRGKLPWSTLGLYDWLRSQVAGVDLRSEERSAACCNVFEGRRFIIVSMKDTTNLKFYRNWNGIFAWLALLGHEARHVGGPAHTTGCPEFPVATGVYGCDENYDLNNLGSYGVQQWLFAGIATGRINVSFGCTPPDSARAYTQSAAQNANGYIRRYVTNPPPPTIATQPYGGPCIR